MGINFSYFMFIVAQSDNVILLYVELTLELKMFYVGVGLILRYCCQSVFCYRVMEQKYLPTFIFSNFANDLTKIYYQ